MKLTQEEFRNLRAHWYRILAESGFKDIERFDGSDMVLIDSKHHYRRTTEFERSMIEEYYDLITCKANSDDTLWKNPVHKHILQRHAEGAKIVTIAHELNKKGTPRSRNSIKVIIRKYEMKWGIKEYEPKELYIYSKDKE